MSRRLVPLTTVCWLTGCAPAAMLRPPIPMLPGQANELGIGALYNTGFGGSETPTYGMGPGAQLWYDYHVSDRFSAGVVAFGGLPSLVGGGIQLRWVPFVEPSVRVGVDLAAGASWGELGLPIAFRLTDRVWVYTAPSFGLRTSQTLRWPVGVALRAGDHVVLTPEVSVGYGSTVFLMGTAYDGVQVYSALGSTFTF